ncbi:unnamed protein product [Coregonus sp. 'balchen']|nr:unnamed protein product [Coregonus sp. 'balchen']
MSERKGREARTMEPRFGEESGKGEKHRKHLTRKGRELKREEGTTEEAKMGEMTESSTEADSEEKHPFKILDSPAEVADKVDRIITMLPSSPNVMEVYTGPNGILKKVKRGTLLIASSTINPTVSKEIALAAEKIGAIFMDAPVSGVAFDKPKMESLIAEADRRA